ncbi:5-(carboxyamino)imidazole ribonucleotide synthase [Hypnocyclicus thermotrophus]|uniref:N5-carboxyaminoimidazole ribonucleotide synthase n=1 Tax=Hypnocyclicus thermotrophus TaxID=1627895 RepID=A0AA46I635_9FUSO|nr:5-(carboxyamino)imidazole ribonucleotide synthase [Hypnocyclicus thermotrophus]TDT71982.1 5-(carboxyamino)imidazole ribonucleotide synthase [Hypnocyclicus thermotrophus]
MKTIGIIGGGQLGKMTILEARKMSIPTIVLTTEHPSPASEISNDYIVGDLYDDEKILELANKCDVVTYEIEHINVKILKEIENQGKKVYPSSNVIEIIQDKSKQKKLLNNYNIPTSYWEYVDKNNLKIQIEKFGFPVVQKSCTGGYDGKGVFILKSKDDIKNIIKEESYFEKYIKCKKELAIMIARNTNGEIKTYPVVEMAFDEKTNICDTVIVPAQISKEIGEKAKKIAIECIKALDGIGIFGIEFFLTEDDEILVNEIAPRPHNSGHYTIEACTTSQYEQFLRAILNYPLGDTTLLSNACMINILGEDGYHGKTKIKNEEEVFKLPKTYLHIYGKRETRPFRKMGHITVLNKDINKAISNAKAAREKLKIISDSLG